MNLLEKASIFLCAILIFKTLETYIEYLKEKRNEPSVKLNSSILLLYMAPIPILAVIDLLGISQSQLFFKSLLLGSACYIASEILTFLIIIAERLFFRFNPKYSEIRIEENSGFIVQELLGPKTYKWSDFKHVELRNELKEIELIGGK